MFKLPAKHKFGQAVPPAIFPPVLGLLGLGVAWRRAEAAFFTPAAIADLMLGAITLLFVFCVLVYAIKLSRRPGVVLDDLKVLPGRGGLSAMTTSMLLLAAALVPFSPSLATGTLFFGLACHIGLAALVFYTLIKGPVEQRQITPIWHLSFVGVILAPLSALPLGYHTLSVWLFVFAVVAALVIWGGSVLQLMRRDPPPPLRPMLAIHLAPASLFGTVATMLGWSQMALGWGIVALGILAVLLVRARYLTVAGFSALWGAFTFPIAACAGMCLTLAAAGQGVVFELSGAVLLVLATGVNAVIAVKVLQGWAKGGLAATTNAAVA